MNESAAIPIVFDLVKDCESYRDQLSTERIRAMEYYDGVMRDTPSDEGRSKVVSRDVRAMVKKVLPAVVRTIMGNDQVVEYKPGGKGDEQQAGQATDYINHVVLPESKGYDAIHDAVHDALRLRNGILKAWYDDSVKVSFSRHSGLTDEAFVQLAQDDSVDVIEHTEREEMVDTPDGPIPVKVHDAKIKRRVPQGRIMAACVPLEEFLIHPDATCIEDSPIVGQKTRLRRTDLVSMGYDKDVIYALPIAGADSMEEDVERQSRREENTTDKTAPDPALQEVDYYELYVRLDMDDDGIAELRRMCFAGGVGEKNLLDNEECDEVQFYDIVAERRPHQWEGNSVADDIAEVQRIKTVLLRQTLDNIYWQNNLQPIVQEGTVENMNAVMNPAFGLPIRVGQGVDVRAAVGYNQVPFMAKDSFAMLEYLDNEATDRTGISDASSGMAPDALQNMTAKATALIEQAGIGQTEMMVRTIAQGLKGFFKGLLRLVIRHQDVPRTVRLRDDWVTFDPRQWNAEMDCVVNTGLGAGTRERDMLVMQQVIMIQEKLLAGFGPDNPFIKPENVFNAVSKLVEAAGLRTPGMYFTEPNPEEVQAKLEAMRNQPNPEEMKIKAQMELEQFKAQMAEKTTMAKMQADANKEKAQMEADLIVKQKEIEATTIAQREALQADAIKEAQRIAFEREKLAAEIMLERERMDREDARAEKQRQSDIAKAQAASIGKAFEKNDNAKAAA